MRRNCCRFDADFTFRSVHVTFPVDYNTNMWMRLYTYLFFHMENPFENLQPVHYFADLLWIFTIEISLRKPLPLG